MKGTRVQMKRRQLLKSIGSAGLAGLASPLLRSQEQVARATRGMATPRIKDISVIECEPAGTRLSVVKITTDQDGLYGYGCATFTQRADLVKPAVEKYLKPFLLGKTTDRIEDIWQSCYDSSYWKNGPVLNNALSGVDQALWDIKGRQAGMPTRMRMVLIFRRLSKAQRALWPRASAMLGCRSGFPEWRVMDPDTTTTPN
jgi:mannonate dehydratase